MHEISRHAIHVTETLQASINTLREMQRHQTDILANLSTQLGRNHVEQAKQYTSFQISLLMSLELRSGSNQERLRNEVNLVIMMSSTSVINTVQKQHRQLIKVQAYNMIANQDNKVMKSINFLALLLLPASFIGVCLHQQSSCHISTVLLTSAF